MKEIQYNGSHILLSNYFKLNATKKLILLGSRPVAMYADAKFWNPKSAFSCTPAFAVWVLLPNLKLFG